MAYKGLDISSWQNGMNIKRWKDALGLSFIILKVGGNEGGRYQDKCFDGFYKQARACGLHVGAYYYTTTTDTYNAKLDAEHCLGLLSGYDLDMPVYMDVEDSRQMALGARALTDIIKVFCDRIEQGGRRGGLYTGGSAWLSSMYKDELLGYADWIAWWADWDGIEELRGRCGDIGMWQVGGISLDGDIVYGDVAGHNDYDLAYYAYWDQLGSLEPTKSEEPKQSGPTPQEKVVQWCRDQVGYVAYNGKHTKYSQYLDSLGDVYNFPKDGYDWCDIFADCAYISCFGKETAIKMINQPKGGCGAGCPWSADYYREMGRFSNTPSLAAQIFFGEPGDEYHTGIVVGYDGNYVYTIEGNTGYSEGYSGGAVLERTYSRGDSRIAGYGMPRWELAGGSDANEGNGNAIANPKNNRDGGKLDVDGDMGWNTTVDLQHVLGTPEDGEISGQWRGNADYHWAVSSVSYGDSDGSLMVEALQRLIGAGVDGQWGPETSTKLQRYLIARGYSCGPCGDDGYFGRDSVKALQRWLNDGAPR